MNPLNYCQLVSVEANKYTSVKILGKLLKSFRGSLRTIYKMSGRSLSVYKDTSASHEYLCTLINNGHEFCKLPLKRTQIIVQ